MHTPITMTRHAQSRRQQRGGPMLVVDLLLAYSAVERAGAGTSTYYFDKPGRRKVMRMLGH
jgi:hypothetical protein